MPALAARRALPMPWQAGALPFTRGFAAGAEDFPAFAEGFGALLGLHHHASSAQRDKQEHIVRAHM